MSPWQSAQPATGRPSLRPAAPWTLCELREDAALHLSLTGPPGSTVRRGDYLTHGSGITGAGFWITNPPWSLAAAFFAKMLE